jgi:SAM-dependent methyltransferase
MTDPAGYIHGSTDVREIARLSKQAAFVAPWSLSRFDASPGMKVLDLGTGIGAMAAQLHKRFPDIELFGLDRDPAQLAVARERHPIATYVEGDATAMPFETATFDRVHATWLLEHVPDPLAVLREVARVLKQGGIAMFVEVDNETLRTDPPFSVVRDVMHALDRAQIAGGGDPYIGRRLQQLFERAGFLESKAQSLPLVGDHGDSTFFRAFIEEFAEIFESLDETLGEEMVPMITDAAERLRSLARIPNGAIHYAPVIGKAVR